MVYSFKYDGWALVGAWAAIRTNTIFLGQTKLFLKIELEEGTESISTESLWRTKWYKPLEAVTYGAWRAAVSFVRLQIERAQRLTRTNGLLLVRT